MAIARTGVFVDDYLEYANTLPAELQRLLNTIRELDDRSQCMCLFVFFHTYTYRYNVLMLIMSLLYTCVCVI
ncbi:putative ING family protein [Helianthus debilis subsp. tardiflorus]